MIGLFVSALESSPLPVWNEVEQGVWVAQIASKDRPTLSESSRSKPRTDRLKALGKGSLPFQLDDVKLVKGKDSVAVYVPLADGEKIFGLGLQMAGGNRRGGVYHLRLDHYEKGNDRLHVPTPLYVSSAGYAVFLNTSRPTNFHVGVSNRLDDRSRPKFRDRNTDRQWDAQPPSNWVEASVEEKGLEVVVFAGPTAMDAIRRYNLFYGGGCLPPIWALGFWHRTPSLATALSVKEEVEEFEKRGFPLDVIGLEPGWQSRSYPGSMEWSSDRFPEPARLVQSMAEKGINVNLWENPFVAPNSNFFTRLKNRFGSHTVWLGAVPDVLDSTARKITQEFHRENHVSLGVSGYKIDEVDGFDVWLWPDHAQFPSGPGGLQMRQVYGVLWQELLFEMYRKQNKRTFGLVRGSNGAASRFPFAIYSDTYDHRQYVTASTNCSLAGTLWCAEIRSADSPEEWVRRMQSACLSPIAQLNAWADGTKPWSFPSVNDTVRDAMLLRQSLVPYLYTAFAQYWLDGTPPVRPMSLVDGGEETDQYLLGGDLLVAPMFVRETKRKIRLPKGRWYDYKTGVFVGEDTTITVSPTLQEIPVFVRGGAAIPTFENSTNVLKSLREGRVTLRCYGEGSYRGQLFEDDGTTFDYERGDFGLFDVLVQDGKTTAQSIDGKRPRPERNLIVDVVKSTK